MGSGSSKDVEETQSAPVTARNTPNQPKRTRNQHFQEVQIGQTGTTPRSKQPQRAQGASPKPPQAASTSQGQSRGTRGQDPGAEGGRPDNKGKQPTPRGAGGPAANGQPKPGRPQANMTGTQRQVAKVPERKHLSVQELLDSMQNPLFAETSKQPVQTAKKVNKEEDKNVNGASNGQNNDPKTSTTNSNAANKSLGNTKNIGNKNPPDKNGSVEVRKSALRSEASRNGLKKTVSFEKNEKENKPNDTGVKKTEETTKQHNQHNQQQVSSNTKPAIVISQTTNATTVKNDNSVTTVNNSNLLSTNSASTTVVKSNIPRSLVKESKQTINTAKAEVVLNKTKDNIEHKANGEIDSEAEEEHEIIDETVSYDEEFYDHDADAVNGYEDHYDDETDEATDESEAEDEDGRVDGPGMVGNVGCVSRVVQKTEMKDDDLVFETFYHRSGKEFQCIYQSGMRFYLDDWGSKEWQPFPKRWYNEGLLVTNTILKDDSTNNEARNDQDEASGSQGQGQGQSRSRQPGGGGGGDDREGFLMHPTRGRIPTYIFYKKHNVHMYFDKDTGSWVRLPVGWELHHNMVKSLVDQVEEAVPTWKDRHDILSLLRACNYDPDECISIYLHLEKDEWFKGPKTAKEGNVLHEKEAKISQLEKKVMDLEIQLQKERNTKEEAERNLEEQSNKLSEIEAESKQTEAQMSAMTGGRPKSARPITRMAMAAKGGKKGKGPPQGETVNPGDVMDLNANAIELRKSHTKLKMEVERYMGDFKHIIGKLGPVMKQMKQSEKGTQSEIEEVRALYRKEALQRKLLFNQLQELRGNIRVFVRVRKDDRSECCMKFPSDSDIVAIHPQQGKKSFSFDKVFSPNSTQEQVFEDTKAIITSCADGYNVCLLAYGQTGSGKTFTMMGPENNPGINIRAMKELFTVCSERHETIKYALTVSLVEIYNETLQDLLTNDAKTLELRTAGNKVSIPGLTEYPISNVDDVKKVMAMGDKNRKVASTKMNSTSSRSHLVLMLGIEGTDKVTNAITRGTLVLCDLAGSERIGKTEAEGQRLVEAAAINKSLSALGQVFTALRTSQLHVPYRNSKLTQILQPSLSGDAKACLFVNVSPDNYNYGESVSTLAFGANARQVALGQAKQNISKGKG